MKSRAQGEWGHCSGLWGPRPQRRGSSLLGPSTGFSSSYQWRRWLCTWPWDGPWEHAGRQLWPGPWCAPACAQCPHLCKGQHCEGSCEQWGHSGLLARASPAGAAGHRVWGEGKARARAPPTQCSSSKAPLFPSCLIPPPAGLWPCPPALLGVWSRNRPWASPPPSLQLERIQS